MQLNEGLEKLGANETTGECEGEVFCGAAIESVRLPSSLKRLEDKTFYKCQNLRSAEISHGIEYIGERCFGDWFEKSKIEELTLPNTLKEIDEHAFEDCNDLKTVWLEEGCTLCIWRYVGYSAAILPAGAMVGGMPLRDLRRQKDVVIPENV